MTVYRANRKHYEIIKMDTDELIDKKKPSVFDSEIYFYFDIKKEAEDFLADDLECRIAQKESHIREYEKEIKELKETLSKFKKD